MKVSIVKFVLVRGDIFEFPVAHNGKPFTVARHLQTWDDTLVTRFELIEQFNASHALNLLDEQFGRFNDFADGNEAISDTEFQQAVELYHVTKNLLYEMDDQ